MPFQKGVKFDYSKRKPKVKTIDTAITFRLPKQDRDDFIDTCNALGLGNGKVLREFMKKFVEEHKEDEEVIEYQKVQKVQKVSE